MNPGDLIIMKGTPSYVGSVWKFPYVWMLTPTGRFDVDTANVGQAMAKSLINLKGSSLGLFICSGPVKGWSDNLRVFLGLLPSTGQLFVDYVFAWEAVSP